MATNYPTSIDVLTNPNATDTVDTVSHSDQHANANDAIEALEAKVGADTSADTTSHDYKLSNVTGTEKAVAPSSTDTLTNKTLTSPTLNTPVINTGDINSPDIDGGTVTDATIENPTINGTVQLDLGTDAEGDIYYRNAAGELTRLPIGAGAEILTVSAGVPSWEPSSGGGVVLRAYKSTNQSVTANVKITFDTESFDTGGNFASSTFTVPADGYYRVNARLGFGTSGGANRFARIYVNGAEVAESRDSTTAATTVSIYELLFLTAADTIEIYAESQSVADVLSGTTESVLIVEQL